MKKYLLLLILCVQAGFLTAQKNVVDKIVAIVGEEIILKSDIENAYLQELVKRIPGILYDAENGKLSYNGKIIQEINVNG